ncbi:glycosyl transferase [Rhodobacteraceae bacterium 4F10]|nr:glycosyl transferase [Rhodobacteraceae bacterium 4F10]
MASPYLSVCIPTYEMGGNGARFLEESLQKLDKQEFRDFEVVVSDQSSDTAIQNVCQNWNNRLAVRHVWNRHGKRQASANVNFAMDAASGEILKILFADDYLSDSKALSAISKAFRSSGKSWLLNGSGVCRDGVTVEDTMVPRLTEKMVFGKNTVSSPSVLAMRKSCTERFDENLIWLMDVEMYQRLRLNVGEPIILREPLIVNRLHDAQVSAAIGKPLRRKEIQYVREKFSGQLSRSASMEYWRQLIKAL